MRKATRGLQTIRIKTTNLLAHERERQNSNAGTGIASATRKTIGRGKISIAMSASSRSGVSIQKTTVPTPSTLPMQMARNQSLRETDDRQKRTPTQKAVKPIV